ncbi:MAG: Hpt domain-containing protein [Planctomycetota bacterium]
MTEHPDFDDEMLGELLGEFLDEAAQLLGILTHRLLEVDERIKSDHLHCFPSRENLDVVNEIFRAAHSIKGASGMLGLRNVNAVTHRLEGQLDDVRAGRKDLTSALIEVLLRYVDWIDGQCARLRDGVHTEMTTEDGEFLAKQEQAAEESQRSLSSPEMIPSVVLAAEDVVTEPIAMAGVAQLSVDETMLPHAGVAPVVDLDLSVNSRVRDFGEEETMATEDLGGMEPEEQPISPPALPEREDANLGQDEKEFAFDVSKYLQLYLDECDEEIESLNHALLHLESDPADRESLNEVFRMAHRIKGSSAAMGFESVTKLTHVIESFFDDLRSGVRLLEEELMNQVFRAVDSLRDFHRSLRVGDQASVDLDKAHDQLSSALAKEGAAGSWGSGERDGIETEPTPGPREDSSSDEVERGETIETCDTQAPSSSPPACCRVEITFEPDLHFVDLKGEVIATKLASRGSLLGCEPPIDQLEGGTRLTISVQTSEEIDALLRLVNMDGVRSARVSRFDANGALVESRMMESVTVGAAAADSLGSMAEEREPNPSTPQPLPPPERSAPAFPSSAASLEQRHANGKGPAVNAVAPRSMTAVPEKFDETVAEPPRVPGKLVNAADNANAKVAETVRVEIDRLDHLMNLAGELVINKARFAQIAGGMQGIFQGKTALFAARDIEDRLAGLGNLLHAAKEENRPLSDVDSLLSQIERLKDDFGVVRDSLDRVQEGRQQYHAMAEAIHQLTRVSDGIQKSVMDTRMVPVGPLFVRFKRVIRDIARGHGKEVNLVIGGEKTELDKRMIDELGDPLIHMVRNAVDHGLETPEEREASGKPRMGTIRLDAMHRGNSVLITISDDGRGIHPDKIRSKLVEKGILGEAEAAAASDKQIINYIWSPGFSTAAKVTDISGRGVGMDIVKNKIEELSGTIDVKSEPGRGSTFTIRLPLTLAIMPSLLATIRGEVYALPLENVEEIVKVPVSEIYSIAGQSTIKVRGRIIAMLRLEDVFSWPTGEVAESRISEPTIAKDHTIVIVQSNDNRIGLVVDSLLGEEDIVVKSLAENFMNIRGLAGASILGNGRVSLILDVGAVLDLAMDASHGAALRRA